MNALPERIVATREANDIVRAMLGQDWTLVEVKDTGWELFHSTLAVCKDGQEVGQIIYDPEAPKTITHSLADWKSQNLQYFEAA